MTDPRPLSAARGMTEAGRSLLASLFPDVSVTPTDDGPFIEGHGFRLDEWERVMDAIVAIEVEATARARPEPGADLAGRLLAAVDEPLAYWRERRDAGDPLATYYVDAFASARHNIVDALAALPASPRYAPAPGGVHTHGVEDGPGLACQEYLIGACAVPASPDTKEPTDD